MGNWIIHVVGETVDDDLAPAISHFVEEIESLAHKVHSVRLTTDAGERVVNIAKTVETDVDTVAKDAAEVDPSLDSTAATVESGVAEADTAVDTGVSDIEKAEAPVSSSTPAADPTSTPVSPVSTPTVEAPVNVVAPADPPVAAASSPASSPTSPSPTTPPAPIPAS